MNVVKAAEERGAAGFSATRPEMERALQTEAEASLFAGTINKDLNPAGVQKKVSRERIELVKFMVHKMLGPKSSRFIMKIDELRDRYGERCCDRMEELDDVAQIFYGKLVAKNLREEIARIVQAPME